MSQRLKQEKPDNFLSVGATGVPILPQERTLFNNAGLINLNNLYKLNGDVQLKVNMAFLTDKRTENYHKSSEVYFPAGTIRYLEKQQNIIRPKRLRGQFVLNGNTKSYYLNNDFTIDYLQRHTRSDLVSNSISGNQFLKQEIADFTNELNFHKKLRSGRIISFYSYLNKISQPEELSITPGLNAAVFNNGFPYSGLIQSVKLPTWFTNNNASMTFLQNRWTNTYKAGFNFQNQELNTRLFRTQNDNSAELVSEAMVNKVKWNKTKLFSNATFEYKSRKLKSTLSLPFSYNSIVWSDELKIPRKHFDRFFIEPFFAIKYLTGKENYITGSYSFKNELGGIEDIFQGAILRDYHSLYANDAILSMRKSNSINAAFRFRKALKMLFFNVAANYSMIDQNTISAYTITENTQQRIALALPNKIQAFIVNGSISKYLFNLTSTVSAGAEYNKSNYEQLQNNLLLPFEIQSVRINFKINSKINRFINWSYSINYWRNNSKALKEKIQKTYQQLQQQSSISLFIFNRVIVNLSAEHIYSHEPYQGNNNFLFVDGGLKYTWLKIKTDFELGITNAGNITTFKAFYLSANSFTSGEYQIPGTMVLLKARFNF